MVDITEHTPELQELPAETPDTAHYITGHTGFFARHIRHLGRPASREVAQVQSGTGPITMKHNVQDQLCVALVVHRSQGATVERTHALEDGGGRELAYVKMSRATDRSTVYVVADSLAQAAADLEREWKLERRLTWVIDRTPATGRKGTTVQRDVDVALRRGRLRAERQAMLAAVPTDPTTAIRMMERELDGLRRRRADLEIGRGSHANHPVNRALVDYERAQENVARFQANLARRLARRDRREKETELGRWHPRLLAAEKALDAIRTPERARLDQSEAEVSDRLADLHEQREHRAAWFERHPEAARRLDDIDRSLNRLSVEVDGPALGADRARAPMRIRPWLREIPAAGRSLDVGLGL